jgi:hypothetical protein
MNKAEQIYREHLRAIGIPSLRGYEYGQMVERMVTRETDIGKFIDQVGPMDAREIGPAMNIYEDQAESVENAVQDYIDETGRAFEKFERAMEEADRHLVDTLKSII